MTRTNVKTANSEFLDQPMVQAMLNLNKTPKKLKDMKRTISNLIDQRHAMSIERDDKQTESKDWSNLEAWRDNDAIARLFIAAKIDPKGYILNPYLDDADLIKRGFDPEARTRNLKAYKKVRECAEYIVTGNAKLEAVFKTFVACSIVASRTVSDIDSNVCERFLSSISLADVSEDLAEAVSEFQAKHMTGGAATQSSQMRLTLANLGAVEMKRNGKLKLFTVRPESGVITALAERFGMQEHLQAIAS